MHGRHRSRPPGGTHARARRRGAVGPQPSSGEARTGRHSASSRTHRRQATVLDTATAVWGEAVHLSVSALRRAPRPLIVPAVVTAVVAVAITAAAAPGGDGPGTARTPQFPYANWVIPQIPPDLAASSTLVSGASTSEPAAEAASKRKQKASRDESEYDAVPAALAASGIPEPALRAYKRAASAAASFDPTCGLRWELLAAIGRVESGHGRSNGSVMTASGMSVPGILGPVLDGSGPFALIRDTDDGKADGDKVYDRAIGPMQFLPQSWSVVRRDGDGDGKVRAQDIDDAAAGAAVYLCGGNVGLRTADGLRKNIYRYNRSDAYVELVVGVMNQYGANVPPITPAEKPPAKKKSAKPPAKDEPAPKKVAPKPAPKPAAPKPAPAPAPTSTATPTPAPEPTSTSDPEEPVPSGDTSDTDAADA